MIKKVISIFILLFTITFVDAATPKRRLNFQLIATATFNASGFQGRNNVSIGNFKSFFTNEVALVNNTIEVIAGLYKFVILGSSTKRVNLRLVSEYAVVGQRIRTGLGPNLFSAQVALFNPSTLRFIALDTAVDKIGLNMNGTLLVYAARL